MSYEFEVKPTRPASELHVGYEEKRRIEINQVLGIINAMEGSDMWYYGDDIEGIVGARLGEGVVTTSCLWTSLRCLIDKHVEMLSRWLNI